MKNENTKKDLLRILTDAVKNKIYGSVEIYFEEGRMTQITQRIINKIAKKSKGSNGNIRDKSLDATRIPIEI